MANVVRLGLVIEDEVDLAFMCSEALKAAGFQVETIRDGLQAQARLAEVKPDVVVLDLHLPGLDGRLLLAQIRSDARLAGTRVIITTADLALADTLRRDAAMTLLKPVSFSQLRDLVKRITPSN